MVVGLEHEKLIHNNVVFVHGLDLIKELLFEFGEVLVDEILELAALFNITWLLIQFTADGVE